MAKKWDRLMKMLIGANPQHLVNWLVKGAFFTEELSRELAMRTIEADVLYVVTLENDQRMVLHVEFQRASDPKMGKRLWEYNVLTTLTSGLPTYSVVIYLKKDRKTVSSPYEHKLPTGEVIHRFFYQSINLWELPVDSFKQPHLEGLLPLLPLLKDGAHREVVEEMISQLRNTAKEDLLPLAFAFAALIFSEEADKEWLKRRFAMLEDLLEESWAYHEMVEKGFMKGLDKGLEQGLEQGLKKGTEQGLKQGREQGLKQEREQGLEQQRYLLLSYVEMHFPDSLSTARRCAEAIEVSSELQQLIIQLFALTNAAKVEQCLLNLLQQKHEE